MKSLSRRNISFLLNHIGLLLALFGGFWGAADNWTSRAVVAKNEPTDISYTKEGKEKILPFTLMMKDFKCEYYDSGEPKYFEAILNINDDDSSQQEAVIYVNNPFNYKTSYDLYLTSYDLDKGKDSDFCIVEVVYQPWKYVSLIGFVMMMIGSVFMFIFGFEFKERRNNDLG